MVPVRPKPVITSSRIRWMPVASHQARNSASMPAGHGRISLTPWISGSITTAAVVATLPGQRAELVQRAHMGHRVAVAFEALEKPADAAERGRAERVAVIAVGEGDEVVASRFAGLQAVLHRHFQRALDGGRAVVGKKHAFQRVCPGTTRTAVPPIPPPRVGEAEKRNVRRFFELSADRGGDHRMGVAVDVGPDRRVAVEVAPALGIPQPRSFAMGEHQWFVPGAHHSPCRVNGCQQCA